MTGITPTIGRPLRLVGGRVFDPERGAFGQPVTIVVRGDNIADVFPVNETDGEQDATVIDLRGRYVLPGLIDAHFHLVSRSAAVANEDLVSLGSIEGVVNAAERLRAGVTTVRDAGCRHRGIHSLVRAIRAGVVLGPRTFVAGRNPTGPLAPAHWRNVVIHGPEEMRLAVRQELDGGADWVKFIIGHAEDPTDWGLVTPYLSDIEIQAGVEEAHARGARVGVHCEGYEMAEIAVRCGVDTLDHGLQLGERTVDAMAAAGTSYVPTLWAFSDDAGLSASGYSPEAQASIRFWQEEHRQSVRRAAAAGVLIAAGSDAAGSLPPGDVLVHEMRALVEAGLSSAEALRAATLAAAQVLGAEDRLGSVQPRKAADLVVVDQDPLQDLRVLSTPSLVIAAGRIISDARHNLQALQVGPSAEAVRTLAGSTSRWAGPMP